MEEASYFISGVLVLLAAAAALFLLSNHLHGRKNLPPSGPFRLPVIGHLHHLLRHPLLHHTLARISARHGPILLLRFGYRSVLVISSLSAAEECFTTNDLAFANRATFTIDKYFGYDGLSVIIAPYGPHWRNMRRITTLHLFSPSRIDAFASIRAGEVRSLLRHLFNMTQPDVARTVEMRSKLTEVIFNVTMLMVAGRSYHGENATASPEEGRWFREIIGEAFRLNTAIATEDFIPLVRWFGQSTFEKRLIALSKELNKLFQEMVDQRRQGIMSPEEKRKTLVDEMLSLQDNDRNYCTDRAIKATIQVLIFGGTETSSSTAEWAMSLLLNHPHVLAKASEEIEMQVGRQRLVCDADLPHLPYLHNVIKETLRLFPATPLLIPRQSCADCTVGGFHVPKGTMLLVNTYAMQRDSSLWDDANEFRPERFEGGKGDHGFKFIPFGHGRRRCPGEGLAMRVIALTLACLIQCFEWERIGLEKVDLTEGVGLTIRKANPLEAMYKPRGDMVNVLSHL